MMKTILILIAILATSTTFADELTWQKMRECDQGMLRIDQSLELFEGTPYHQLVISGPTVKYFISKNAIPAERVNDKGEFIVPLVSRAGDLRGFIGLQQGVQILYLIRNENDSVKLLAYRDDRTGGPIGELANWIFRDCR